LVSDNKGEHKLRVFEDRVLRRTFGPKGDEVTGGCKKLYNEELHNLYSSPSIIRMTRLAGHVALMGEKRNAYRLVLGNTEVKRPLEIKRRRWVDNIKIDFREIGWGPPLVPILNQIDLVYTIPNYLSKIYLTLSTRLHLGLPSGLFPSGFPINILYVFLFYPFVLHTPPISSFFT
jgi:hypothetical protein